MEIYDIQHLFIIFEGPCHINLHVEQLHQSFVYYKCIGSNNINCPITINYLVPVNKIICLPGLHCFDEVGEINLFLFFPSLFTQICRNFMSVSLRGKFELQLVNKLIISSLGIISLNSNKKNWNHGELGPNIGCSYIYICLYFISQTF